MTAKAGAVRIMLVDDQVLFRKGLARVLADWPDLCVVGDAEDGHEAVMKAATLRPDVILMDINMPNVDGLEATRLIRRDLPETKVLMLTISEQDDHLFRAIKLGACGYLLKNLNPQMLHEMVLAVARGEVPISPLMAKKVLQEFARQMPANLPAKPEQDLTAREVEVLELVMAGADNAGIAERLCVASGTVKRHLHNILAKLHARNRGEAVAAAVQHGIISPYSAH